jgi:hypothetical protein
VSGSSSLVLQYRSRFDIRSREGLVGWLTRYQRELAHADIQDCYPGIER